MLHDPFSPDAAIGIYRDQLERYRETLNLLSPAGFAQLDRLLEEGERYAALIAALTNWGVADAEGGTILDVGSGAGLPGVVIAARLAPRPVWLVERRSKRATFLRGVAAGAGLQGVRVFSQDVRRLEPPPGGLAVITAQAVASLRDIAAWTVHLWGPEVLMLSRKGPDWADEVTALRGWWLAEGPGRRLGAPEVSEAAPRVVATEPLNTRGTLVAIRMAGG
jgi:16S rRNA (guanine527-N7)-methyltransferase